jgi:hypothetical protein
MDPISFKPDEGETLVFKFETDSTVPNEVFCLTIIDAHTGQITRYAPGYLRIRDGLERLRAAKLTISHSNFHRKVATKYYGIALDRFFDTCAAAKERMPHDTHKLSDWAQAFQMPLPRGGANDVWSSALQHRCDSGARVILRLYLELTAPAEAQV